MNKPQRHLNLEKMTDQELVKKRKDILMCIMSCHKETLPMYGEQIDALDAIVSQRKQMVIDFERRPGDDEMPGEEVPLFV